jgi:hypothetical protein
LEEEPVSDQPAKKDFAKVHLKLARWYLAHGGQEPDQPETLFDVAEDQAIDEAKARHPARPVTNVESDAL